MHMDAVINAFVHEFRNIDISIPPNDPAASHSRQSNCVFVHAPYMQQSVTLLQKAAAFQELPERHRKRLQNVKAARDAAEPEVRAFLAHYLTDEHGRERSIASGRAELAAIRHLLQDAVRQRLVPASPGHAYPHSRDLRLWLKRYGIGIDCSGFVQQALQKLVDEQTPRARQDIHEDKSSATGHRVGFLRCGWVYRDITECSQNPARIFDAIATPAQTRPGDLLVNRHHMRIVMDVEACADGSLRLVLAESTSARDIPEGHAGAEEDTGPRVIRLVYPSPNRPIAQQTPQTERSPDGQFPEDSEEKTYVIGRYRMLGKL
jgi:hypothetical protein